MIAHVKTFGDGVGHTMHIHGLVVSKSKSLCRIQRFLRGKGTCFKNLNSLSVGARATTKFLIPSSGYGTSPCQL